MTGKLLSFRSQPSFWKFLQNLPASLSSHPLGIKNIITVSREPGSAGRPIAKIVSRELGFEFYNKKLIELIAKETDKEKKLIKELDEHFKGAFEEFFTSLFAKPHIPRMNYYISLCRVILKIAYRGKAVILGRGANFILPPEKTLRVRVIAPLNTRLKNAVIYEGHTPEKAQEVIRKYHFTRKEFVKKTFGKDISNANHYDLVVNTQNISISQAVSIIKHAYRQKFA